MTDEIKTTLRADAELTGIIRNEKKLQTESICLIASENYTSRGVEECLGSCLTNRYSEGQVGKRYYGGTQNIDALETLCKARVLKTFLPDEKERSEWDVNVQALSGSPANLAVFTGLLQPHDRIMFLDLASGGHLSHGYYTEKKKLTATAKYFDTLPYFLDPKTQLVDFDALERDAIRYRPKLIVCGFSAYPRHVDFARFRSIADVCDAYLLADISHISGLVATGFHPSPFPHVHIVTSTTHKTFRGPRGALIFYNLNQKLLKQKIDGGVFPGIQGGPHNNVIAGIAFQAAEVRTPMFKDYIRNVTQNAKSMAESFKCRGYDLITDGTDTHLIVIDLRSLGIPGKDAEMLLESVGIICNKNAVPGDHSALSPGGIRLGTAAMTTRGLSCSDFENVVIWIDRVLRLAKEEGFKYSSPKNAKKFTEGNSEMLKIREAVKMFAKSFSIPGGEI